MSKILSRLSLALALALLGVGLGNLREARAFPGERPNIVFILTDDLDLEAVTYMPNLRNLMVNQGTTFENFFVTHASCSPSRASILRGQYYHNHQVFTNTAPLGGFTRFRALGHENSTIATWLQAAGYRTVMLGKYLNLYPDNDLAYIPPGWNEWFGVLGKFGHYIDYSINENGLRVFYGDSAEDYETDVLSRKTAGFIRRHAGQSPFFVYLAPYAPHDRNTPIPPMPAPRHQNEFVSLKAPRRPSFNEEDVSDKPAWIRMLPPLSTDQMNRIDASYRDRLRSMLAVDDMIKSVVDTLAALQLLEETYIVFTSDNGFHFGEHRRLLNKTTAYEEALHLPLIVRGPGVPAGRTLKHFVANIDFAPTFAELGGAELPDFVDGRSFAPLLQENVPSADEWDRAVLIENAGLEDNGIPEYQAIRTRNYLYVEYPQTAEGELYDMRTDPFQSHNIYATASVELHAELAAKLDSLRDCVGGNCNVLAVLEQSAQAPPASLELRQNYPNPFNPATELVFSLHKDAKVSVQIHDLAGGLVANLFEGRLLAGSHRLVWRPNARLASGVYMAVLRANQAVQTKKMLLLR